MSQSIQSRILGVVIVLFCVAAISGHAQALSKKERYRSFSDENVRAFIEDTTAMTSVQNVRDDIRDVEVYLDRHIEPDARFKTDIKYIIPGMPEQDKILSLAKHDYIEQVKQGAESVEHYHSDIQIESIDISEDKKTASVKTVSIETGVMKVPQEDGSVSDVPIDGRSECFQVLKISRKGYIQMYSANCKTVMEFQPN